MRIFRFTRSEINPIVGPSSNMGIMRRNPTTATQNGDPVSSKTKIPRATVSIQRIVVDAMPIPQRRRNDGFEITELKRCVERLSCDALGGFNWLSCSVCHESEAKLLNLEYQVEILRPRCRHLTLELDVPYLPNSRRSEHLDVRYRTYPIRSRLAQR